jgi:RNA polymerase sigma-32 factor
MVKIATTKAQRKLFFNLRRMKKDLNWLTHEETQAVAKDLGVTPAEVTEMEQRLSARDMSFDPAPEADDEDSYGPSLYLPAPAADPAEQAEDSEWDADVRERLNSAIARLDGRSQDILRRRWINEDKPTLHELAAEYGVSAERIRQIEAAAMKRVKTLMAA